MSGPTFEGLPKLRALYTVGTDNSTCGEPVRWLNDLQDPTCGVCARSYTLLEAAYYMWLYVICIILVETYPFKNIKFTLICGLNFTVSLVRFGV